MLRNINHRAPNQDLLNSDEIANPNIQEYTKGTLLSDSDTWASFVVLTNNSANVFSGKLDLAHDALATAGLTVQEAFAGIDNIYKFYDRVCNDQQIKRKNELTGEIALDQLNLETVKAKLLAESILRLPAGLIRDNIKESETYIKDLVTKLEPAIDGHEIVLYQALKRLEGYDSYYEQYRESQVDPETPKPREIDVLKYSFDMMLDHEVRFMFSRAIDEFGLSSATRNDIVSATLGTPIDEEWDRSRQRVVGSLLGVKIAVEWLGVENVKLIHRQFGITNFHRYNVTQLRRMVKLAEGDKDLLEDLHASEVCVVYSSASQDHNNAFSSLGNLVETTGSSTLFFELDKYVEKNMDAYSKVLESVGVEASSFVIAGHGEKGSINLGQSYLVYDKASIPEDVSFDAEGITRILSSMKPDIDGNCSVLLMSCSQSQALESDIDNALTRFAKLIKTLPASSGKTYQLYGVPVEVSVDRKPGGEIYTSHRRIRVRPDRVVLSSEGNIYQHVTNKDNIAISSIGTLTTMSKYKSALESTKDIKI